MFFLRLCFHWMLDRTKLCWHILCPGREMKILHRILMVQPTKSCNCSWIIIILLFLALWILLCKTPTESKVLSKSLLLRWGIRFKEYKKFWLSNRSMPAGPKLCSVRCDAKCWKHWKTTPVLPCPAQQTINYITNNVILVNKQERERERPKDTKEKKRNSSHQDDFSEKMNWRTNKRCTW